MKRFIDRKYTVNIALILVAVIGIAIGGFITATGKNMTKVTAAKLKSSSEGSSAYFDARFGADFYTYVYESTQRITDNANATASGVKTVNKNMQSIVDAQCKEIKSIGKAVMMFGLFSIALFLCIGCTSVKVNPCYIYDESKDKKYQKHLAKELYEIENTPSILSEDNITD